MVTLFLAYIPAALLLAIFALQLWRRPLLVSRIRSVFWTCVIIMCARLAHLSALQYISWRDSGPPTSDLLPPATPITYYLFYILMRFWLPYLLSLAFGGLAFLGAKYLNKKYDERFFHPEEYYLIALGFFLCPHPFWLGFMILAAFGYLIYSLITAIRQGNGERASFYYLWLPAALIISLLIPWLTTLPFLAVLKV